MALPPNFPDFRMAVVRRATPKESLIRWAIRPTDFDLADIRYEIFKSQSEMGPWDHLVTVEEGAYQYVDRAVSAPNEMYAFYYVVRIASISGAGFRDTAPITVEHDPDHIAKEMTRKKEVFFRARSGIHLAVLNAKSWGAKCSRCWDPVKKLPTDPDCRVCYGTGIMNGYLRPQFVWGILNPPRELVIRAGVPFAEGTAYAEIGPAPFVGLEDILVDRTVNMRYRVNAVQLFSHRGHVVSQVITMALLDENDVVYAIHVPEPEAAERGESFAPQR